jgi:hypothetical protein
VSQVQILSPFTRGYRPPCGLWTPDTLTAMLAALEAERGAILQAATAKVGDKVHRAQRVILALPGVMAQYAKQIL